MRRIKPEERILVSLPEYQGPGIYMLRNITNGKVYIGSAKNVSRRAKEHDQSFRHGTCNNKIQADIDKGHKFICEVLEKCDNMMFVEMRARENYYAEKYNSFSDGYNTAVVPTYDLNFFIQTGNRYMICWLTRKV